MGSEMLPGFPGVFCAGRALLLRLGRARLLRDARRRRQQRRRPATGARASTRRARFPFLLFCSRGNRKSLPPSERSEVIRDAFEFPSRLIAHFEGASGHFNWRTLPHLAARGKLETGRSFFDSSENSGRFLGAMRVRR